MVGLSIECRKGAGVVVDSDSTILEQYIVEQSGIDAQRIFTHASMSIKHPVHLPNYTLARTSYI